ncbi:MAG: FecR domain-containing protein [Pseudomonadota bacterium]
MAVATSAMAVEQAGVAAAVVSPVSVEGAPRPAPADMRSGDQVFTDDRIRTGDGARAQIMFLDQTALTIGPNSDLVIDRFVYDPEQGTGEIAAEMATGFLRYLSGSVGAAVPDNVTISTPAATIGIRGSAIIIASVPGDPNTWFCGVLGPGLVNNALARRGACLLENEEGETEIRAAGFGAFVTKGQAPGDPIPIPEDLMLRVHNDLRPSQLRAALPLGGVGNSGDTSGQNVVDAGTQARQASRVLNERFDELTVNLSTNIVNPLPPEIPDIEVTPDPTLSVPFIAQSVVDGDVSTALAITGEITFAGARFQVTPDNPVSPPNLDGVPFATLETGPPGTNGQVAEINDLSLRNDITRISVFNLSNQVPGNTDLANEAGLLVALLRNGIIQRGPGGSVVINGDLIDQISPARGGAGNTFVAFEIDGQGAITRIGTLTDFDSLGDVQ